MNPSIPNWRVAVLVVLLVTTLPTIVYPMVRNQGYAALLRLSGAVVPRAEPATARPAGHAGHRDRRATGDARGGRQPDLSRGGSLARPYPGIAVLPVKRGRALCGITAVRRITDTAGGSEHASV